MYVWFLKKTSPQAPGLEPGALETLDTWHVLPLDTLDDLVARFILPVPDTLRADYNR